MTKLKEFFNKVSNNNRIFTAEDIGEMSRNEFSENEKAIDYQVGTLGVPNRADLSGNSDVVYVSSYTRSDGTEVKAHYRSKSGGVGISQGTPTGAAANTEQATNFGGGVSNPEIPIEDLLVNTIHNSQFIKEKVPKLASRVQDYKTATNYVKQHYSDYNNFTNTNSTDFSNFELTHSMGSFNAYLNPNRPDTRELMNICLSFDNLPEHPNFSVFQANQTEYVNNVLDINDSKGLKIPNDWPGVIYNHNSGFSNRLSNSSELQSQVKAMYDPKTNSFKKNQILLDFKQDKNLNYSIGHGTILNPRVDNDGNFTAMLFDKYDFDWQMKKMTENNSNITSMNNFMAVYQKTSRAQNYYVIVPIKFKMR